MKRDYMELRIKEEAAYIILTGSTMRETATHCKTTKSTVLMDMKTRIKEMDYELYKKVRTVIEKNKAERHLRGGHMTSLKYQEIRSSQGLLDN